MNKNIFLTYKIFGLFTFLLSNFNLASGVHAQESLDLESVLRKGIQNENERMRRSQNGSLESLPSSKYSRKDINLLIDIADTAASMGRPVAYDYYTKAINLDPNSAELYHKRCSAFFVIPAGKFGESGAFQDCSQSILLNPRYDAAYATRCKLHWRSQNAQPAIADCQAAIRINSNNTEANRILQEIQMVNDFWGSINELVESLAESCSKDPQCAQGTGNTTWQPAQSDNSSWKQQSEWQQRMNEFDEQDRRNEELDSQRRWEENRFKGY